MATTTTTKHLLQHPSHEHPLKPLELSNAPIAPDCLLCHRKISATEAYGCQQGCETFYYHKVCVEAPPQIDRHPLHLAAHPLPLIHDLQTFTCDACREYFNSGGSFFSCSDCGIHLDICCTLSTLSDEGGFQGGKTSELINHRLHPHTLTSFSSRHDFVGDSDCYICRGRVEGDGYMCLQPSCEFIIHKGCIRDLYYADGTKPPRVYHGHPLEIFVGEDTGSIRCASCRSDKAGEFIGCASCQVFYHRDCFQVPEILLYPSHDQDHTFVLFLDIGTLQQCQSCSSSLKDEIYYRCTSCEFFMCIGCGFKSLTYWEEGMSSEIELSWHNHPLFLCHRTESSQSFCFYCGDMSIGPTYDCKAGDCSFLLHKRCAQIESTIIHPHHPDHPLTLCKNRICFCKACDQMCSEGFRFSCERCCVNLHRKCAARFPNHKHYLHEHKLLRFESNRSWECNRCSTGNDSTIFRCVPCNFNLHEECMELPQVKRNDKIHWHPLTLHETFLEDDSGEYYCEHCEKTRDPRLGAYVCGECKISVPRIYHIHCVLPELQKMYLKEHNAIAIQRLADEIARREEEVLAAEENLEEMKRELDEVRKKHEALTLE